MNADGTDTARDAGAPTSGARADPRLPEILGSVDPRVLPVACPRCGEDQMLDRSDRRGACCDVCGAGPF